MLTVHTSKGLEFPIAYVPFGWDRYDGTPDLLRCHDTSGRRILDVRGRERRGRADLLAAHRREEAGETLRLLYVALTRASRMLVVHWASSKTNTRTAPAAPGAVRPGADRWHRRDGGLSRGGPTDRALAASPWVAVEQVAADGVPVPGVDWAHRASTRLPELVRRHRSDRAWTPRGGARPTRD